VPIAREFSIELGRVQDAGLVQDPAHSTQLRLVYDFRAIREKDLWPPRIRVPKLHVRAGHAAELVAAMLEQLANPGNGNSVILHAKS
jgi:hypothetical protein